MVWPIRKRALCKATKNANRDAKVELQNLNHFARELDTLSIVANEIFESISS